MALRFKQLSPGESVFTLLVQFGIPNERMDVKEGNTPNHNRIPRFHLQCIPSFTNGFQTKDAEPDTLSNYDDGPSTPLRLVSTRVPSSWLRERSSFHVTFWQRSYTLVFPSVEVQPHVA